MLVWEGVIGDIDGRTIDRVCASWRVGGPRSRLVFTYGERNFAPETAATRALRAGFSTCDEIAGDEDHPYA